MVSLNVVCLCFSVDSAKTEHTALLDKIELLESQVSPAHRALNLVYKVYLVIIFTSLKSYSHRASHRIRYPFVRSVLLSMSVCSFVCLSVCLSARITRKPHCQTSPIFLHVICGRGSIPLDRVAICYVLPVLRMTSCFHTMGPVGQNQARTALYLEEVRQVAVSVGRQTTILCCV